MLDTNDLNEKAKNLAQQAQDLAQNISAMQHSTGVDPFIFGLTVFVLACFVGYFVVWRVTPALHTPLMSVTNAISGIIIVGAIIAVGPKLDSTDNLDLSHVLGFIAILIASINIFGGFIV